MDLYGNDDQEYKVDLYLQIQYYTLRILLYYTLYKSSCVLQHAV